MSVWKDIERLLGDIEKSLHENLKGTPAADLSTVSVHILSALYTEDGQYASVLARNVGRAATSFTPLLDKLQNDDLIERRLDPQDRRAVRIHLTSKGKTLRPHIGIALSQLEAEYPEYARKVGADEPAEIAEPA